MNDKSRALAVLVIVGGFLGIAAAVVPQAVPQPSAPIQAASDDDVRAFCSAAVKAVGTYGFHDYRLQFERAKSLFTNDGWRGMDLALEKQRVIEALVNNHLVQATEAEAGGCTIVAGETRGGTKKWKVQATGTRTVLSPNLPPQRSPVTITMNLGQRASGPILINNWIE